MGKLAVYLSILGFDVMYQNDFDDPTLAEMAEALEIIRQIIPRVEAGEPDGRICCVNRTEEPSCG